MRDLWYGTSGPQDAPIVLVGEAWGADEAAAQLPFIGMSGNELTRILAEARLDRKQMLLTNVVADRPLGNEMWRFFHEDSKECPAPSGSLVRGLHPHRLVCEEVERLHSQITAHPRTLVIACGNYALWAVGGHGGISNPTREFGFRRTPTGIGDWRGSMVYCEQVVPAKPYLLPIYHPAGILRDWTTRAITVHDLKARVPFARSGNWRPKIAPTFWAPPTFDQARLKLESWLRLAQAGHRVRLACDIETVKKQNLITCIGFADSKHFAMAIPLVRKTGVKSVFSSYWPIEQENALSILIQKILVHENILIEGQNFIYDTQYFQHWYGVTPKLDFDTMLAQHFLFPGTTKGLDYISSLFCEYHWFWKSDSKDWDEKGTLEQLLEYNCLDLIRTFEAAETQRELIIKLGKEHLWEKRKKNNDLALRMMNRGVRIDHRRRSQLSIELMNTLTALIARLDRIFPQELVQPGAKVHWSRSSKQLKILFGEILGVRLPKSRKTGNITLGKEALQSLPAKHPEFKPIFKLLEDMRSVGVFRSTFVEAKTDHDGRMRCSYNPSGTETFRWSSSKNAFGRGTNLQNLPEGDED